jgi:hypothetical protein
VVVCEDINICYENLDLAPRSEYEENTRVITFALNSVFNSVRGILQIVACLVLQVRLGDVPLKGMRELGNTLAHCAEN